MVKITAPEACPGIIWDKQSNIHDMFDRCINQNLPLLKQIKLPSHSILPGFSHKNLSIHLLLSSRSPHPLLASSAALHLLLPAHASSTALRLSHARPRPQGKSREDLKTLRYDVVVRSTSCESPLSLFSF